VHVEPDIGIFSKTLSTLEDQAFVHLLAHVSGKADKIFWKISPQMYLWTRKN